MGVIHLQDCTYSVGPRPLFEGGDWAIGAGGRSGLGGPHGPAKTAPLRPPIAEPTVLLLDEPTNHLDLPAMEWLEDYLEDFVGGLVVVSHDRVFLDRVTDEICELEGGRWTIYPSGGFTRYLEEKERRQDQLEA